MTAKEILIDFETYSELDVKRVGAWAYSEHPSTDLICMSWSTDLQPEPELWVPGDPFPKPLLDAILAMASVEAHNSQFERAIWQNVAVPKYDFPPIFEQQWRCSLAVCAFRALPLGLEDVCKVLQLPVQKDMDGNKAMRKISRPDRNGERPEDFDLEQKTYSYCLDDNRAERLVKNYVGSLPDYELPVWQLDQRIQERGLRIDIDLCRAAIEVADQYTERLNAELQDLTGGAVETAGQRDKLIAWLDKQDVYMQDLTAERVDAALTEKGFKEDRPEAHRVLEIRRYLSRSSHKKYERALQCLGSDGRVRGATQYYGATTGRNAGRLFQPLNMRRPVFCEDTEAMADAIKTRDLDFIEMIGGANVMEVLADAVRGIIISDDDKELLAGDYSSIEAVITAGIANETEKLEVFRRGDDPYCWFASKVLGRTIPNKGDPNFTEQDAKDRQRVGKPGELAFGYSGGVGAWRKFDTSDTFDDGEVDQIKTDWRNSHPRIVELWNALDYCAMNAVLNPGEPFTYTPPECGREKSITYIKRGDFLLCQLPGGRRLHYFKPKIRDTLMPWTDKNDDPVYRPQVWYWTMSDGRWQMVKGWRGQWTENIVQAMSRDVLTVGCFAVERFGYPIILTVYDEILTEPGLIMKADPREFEATVIRNTEPWFEDWPIKIEAWKGRRYKK